MKAPRKGHLHTRCLSVAFTVHMQNHKIHKLNPQDKDFVHMQQKEQWKFLLALVEHISKELVQNFISIFLHEANHYLVAVNFK